MVYNPGRQVTSVIQHCQHGTYNLPDWEFRNDFYKTTNDVLIYVNVKPVR